MRLPLIAAFGLLATSFAALALSLSGHSERSVEHLVNVPGVQQGPVAGGAGGMFTGVASGSSPFAVYAPPASSPSRSATPGPAASASPAQPSPPPAAPTKHHR